MNEALVPCAGARHLTSACKVLSAESSAVPCCRWLIPKNLETADGEREGESEERAVALLPTVLSFLKSQQGCQVETQAKYSHHGQKRWCLRGTAWSPVLQQFWAPARHISFFYWCFLSHAGSLRGCEWLCSPSSPLQLTWRGWKMLSWALHYTAPSVSAPHQLLGLPATIALACQRWSQGCLASA